MGVYGDFHFVTCQKINDEELWVCTFKEHAMAVVELQTGKCRLIDGPSVFSVANWGGSKGFITIGDDMFFVELSGRRLLKYNSRDKTIQSYPLMQGYFNGSDTNYLLAFIYEDYIWIFPKYENIIYAYSLEDGKILTYEIALNDKEKELYVEQPLFIKAERQGNKVVLYSTILKRDIIFDLCTKEVQFDNLPENIASCVDISIYNNKIYALTTDNRVFCWQKGNLSASILLDYPSNEGEFSRIVATNYNIWILPSRGDKTIIYDFSSGQCYEYKDYPNGFVFNEECERQSRFFLSTEAGEVEFFSMCATNYMLSINKVTGKANWLHIQGPSEKEFIDFYKKVIQNIVFEGPRSLEWFVDLVRSKT